MPEIVAQLDILVIATDGRSYFPRVVAEPGVEERWQAWLEFVPLDDSESLLTDIQTTQSSRDDVARWASTLTDTFVEGAFPRWAGPITGIIGSATVAAVNHRDITAASPAVDPFALYAAGGTALRAALLPLTRAELLTIISVYGLNPAQLSTEQLVTFILTATEAQIKKGRRSGE